MIFTAKVSGYEVQYDNNSGKYLVLENESAVKESSSFDAINKFIETGGEKKEKRVRINKKAILSDYRGYIECIITAMAESRYDNNGMVWITVGSKRQKEELKDIIAYTPENLDIIRKIKECEQEITKMDNQKSELRRTLTPVTIDMLQEGD